MPPNTVGEHVGVAIDRVLAAVDFSEGSTLVVSRAYDAAKPGGTVHLLHVVKLTEPRVTPNPMYAHYVPGRAPTAEERRRELHELEETLKRLIPPDAEARGIQTEVLALEARNVSRAIVSTAERLGVSLICLGSRHRLGLLRLLGESVSRAVFTRSTVSVLIVRRPS